METASLTTASSASAQAANGHDYRGPFAVIAPLPFLGWFMPVFNDILIPCLKEAFGLDCKQAVPVQFVFSGTDHSPAGKSRGFPLAKILSNTKIGAFCFFGQTQHYID